MTFESMSAEPPLPLTPFDVRLAARNGKWTEPTAGLAPGYLQANMVILPERYATDFRNLCKRNPVPCPLLAESEVGDPTRFKSYIPNISGEHLFSDLVSNLPQSSNFPDHIECQKLSATLEGTKERVHSKPIDVRSDLPRYNIYHHGNVANSVTDVTNWWSPESIAFLIGCSFTFEAALSQAGLAPRHILLGQNVPMYKTKLALCGAGIFTGATYVVSMRPYRKREIERVRTITRAFGLTHGEPIDWGWDGAARLGIDDIDRVDWGSASRDENGQLLGEARQKMLRKQDVAAGEEDPNEVVPVFWGCGVTPQEAIIRAGSLIDAPVISHSPGHMLLLDVVGDETRT